MYELFISSSILMLMLRSLLSPPPPVERGGCGGAGGPCGGFPWSAICVRSRYYFSRSRAFLDGARAWFLCLNFGWNLSGQRAGDNIAGARGVLLCGECLFSDLRPAACPCAFLSRFFVARFD